MFNVINISVLYKICLTLMKRLQKIDEITVSVCSKEWTNVIPSNVSFVNFEQSVGQKLPRINGF